MNFISTRRMRSLATDFDSVRWDNSKTDSYKAWWLRSRVYRIINPDEVPYFHQGVETFFKNLAGAINAYNTNRDKFGKPIGFSTCIACWNNSGSMCLKISKEGCIEFPKIKRSRFVMAIEARISIDGKEVKTIGPSYIEEVVCEAEKFKSDNAGANVSISYVSTNREYEFIIKPYFENLVLKCKSYHADFIEKKSLQRKNGVVK